MASNFNYKMIFFMLISLALAAAAGLDLFIAYELKDQCSTVDLETAPIVAGTTLLGTFLVNGAWIGAKRKGKKSLERVSIFIWTATTVIGIAGAGATLGQIELYKHVCPDLDDSVDYKLHQYISIALLVVAVALPHAVKFEKSDTSDSLLQPATNEGEPISNANSLKKRSPLVFL